tara:strand:+ start:2881 stop:3723 length:843 start_codon:yes stop_codon:yes gene_type:complete
MRCLILGSSGQVGSALAEYYEKQEGVIVDYFDIVKDELQDLRIHQNELLKDKIKKADFVFFLAFDVGGSRYLKKYQNTFEFVQNNMLLMTNTFNCLREYNKPFIFASSQMSNMDYSSYGTLKRLGEWYTKILDGLVVKFWNVYGIEEDLEKSHVITDFIIKAKDNGIIDMLTDGTEERQFLYSEDCCECLDAVRVNYNTIERDKELHITNHEWNTILEVAEEVCNNYESKIVPSEERDMVQRDKRNEPDSYILQFWKPKTSLGEGIKNICNHYKEGDING